MLLPLDIFTEILKHIPYSEQGYLRLTCKAIYMLPLTFEQACSIPSMAECLAFVSELSENDQAKISELGAYSPTLKIHRDINPTRNDLEHFKDFVFAVNNFHTDNLLIYRHLCKSRKFCRRVFPEIDTDLNIMPQIIRIFNRTSSDPYRTSSVVTDLLNLFKDEISDKIEADVTQVFGEDQLGCIFNDDAYDCNPPRLTEVISYIMNIVAQLSVADLKTFDDMEVLGPFGHCEITEEAMDELVQKVMMSLRNNQ